MLWKNTLLNQDLQEERVTGIEINNLQSATWHLKS
jgi:hypothetical protein